MRKAYPPNQNRRRAGASMGPQLDSCGKRTARDLYRMVQIASMGPQLDSCGKSTTPENWRPSFGASMGPQLDSCGKGQHRFFRDARFELQWGRNLTVAESRRRARTSSRPRSWASMGPQLDSCGKPGGPARRGVDGRASMGPQLDSCGKVMTSADLSFYSVMLQWGRNLTVAERRWSRRPRP